MPLTDNNLYVLQSLFSEGVLIAICQSCVGHGRLLLVGDWPIKAVCVGIWPTSVIGEGPIVWRLWADHCMSEFCRLLLGGFPSVMLCWASSLFWSLPGAVDSCAERNSAT